MATGFSPQIWRRLRRPYRLTLAGLWGERLAQAFWPLWSLVMAALAAAGFGLGQTAGAWALGLMLAAVVTVRGWRAFRAPTRAEALARIDAGLKGHPLQALADRQGLGLQDPQSRALWQGHLARMALAARAARAVPPDLRLSAADPMALRLAATTALIMALIFGPHLRLPGTGGTGAPGGAALAAGPSWEGWASPPPHTGLPRLYLNDQPEGALRLPQGTAVLLRLYGAPGDLTLLESVSGRPDTDDAGAGEQGFAIVQAGLLAIEGPGGRSWQVEALPDAPPKLTLTGTALRQADGGFSQRFQARDDHGVTGGAVTITLDLAAVDRRFGLSVPPESLAPITLDLPMPIRGGRKDFAGELTDDLSTSVLANLPVTMAFSLTDGAGQTGRAAPLSLVLPGRRFFEPLAAAIAELRRDLLWSRANAPRVLQVLQAITHRPEALIRGQRATLRLRVLIRALQPKAHALDAADRDRFAAEMWDIALLVEEGDLASALERLQRAQDRLDEAIRRGASPSETEALMDEMRRALDNYLGELARKQEQQGESGGNGPQMSMSADQLQQMFDRLQELMDQGRTEEAAELMEQLRRFMENMQVTQGGQGGGQGAGQAMRDLQDTLRDQQDLSDEAFRELQDGAEGEALPERQGDLADRLERLERGDALPGAGGEKGEAGRQALERSGRAMRQAENALRQGDLPGAVEGQAEAMEALREGLRNFGEAMAEGQPAAPPGQTQSAEGPPDAMGLDPLGRAPGNAARIGSDENMLPDKDLQRRAGDLLDEIRKRAGEQGRPEAERNYLGRLLDLFAN